MELPNKEYSPKSTELNLKEFVEFWNSKYPWDLWWRKKHKVAFGSVIHKEMSHLDMLIEYIESKYMEDKRLQRELEEEEKENSILNLAPGKKEIKMSKKELDSEFESLNIDEFNISKENT